jgi:hypothetical protein
VSPSEPSQELRALEILEESMLKAKLDGNGSLSDATEQGATAAAEPIDSGGDDRSDVIATVATVAVVGIGAAAFEAALLPGIILGVAAMWFPQYFPKMGEALNPLFRSTVRGAYKLSKKTKEVMADAHEQVHDIMAEVHAEADQDRTSPKGAAAGGLPT